MCSSSRRTAHPPPAVASWPIPTWISPANVLFAISSANRSSKARMVHIVPSTARAASTSISVRGSQPRQHRVVQVPIAGDRLAAGDGRRTAKVGESSPGLLDEDFQRRDVPDLDPCLKPDVGLTVDHHHPAVTVAEAPPPAPA